MVVCSRERPEDLARCLASLRLLRYDDLEVLVVDNAPTTGRTRDVVEAAGDPRVRYLCEPRPGLSRARNHGVRASTRGHRRLHRRRLRVDASWLDAPVRGFSREAEVGWGTRFAPAAFEVGRGSGDELLPFRAGTVGAGASFAVSRAALVRIGGFDEALGAATASGGGEDLDCFSRLLLEGFVIAYEPSSVAWHYHRRAEEEIWRQLVGYGSGLTAYATKQLVSRRSRGAALRRLRSRRGSSNGTA